MHDFSLCWLGKELLQDSVKEYKVIFPFFQATELCLAGSFLFAYIKLPDYLRGA